MNFVGSGLRLAPGDVGDAARALGVETAVLLAFMEVEAAGRGFDGQNRPTMLYEPHVMYRNTSGASRDKAVREGVAYAKWGAKPYPRDSYPRLKQAIAIVREPAFRSASYGLGQILGENYSAAGFVSAEQMFRAMKRGEREQLMAMVAFLHKEGFVLLLTNRDFTKAESWVPAVRKYNGSGYAKHNYHGRMAQAYIKHKGGGAYVPVTNVSVLVHGMKGEAVHGLQADLFALGFDPGPIDGRFGDKTEAAVKAFQLNARLGVDGKAGPKTLAALEAAIAHAATLQQPPPPLRPGQLGLFASAAALLGGFFVWLLSRRS